MNDLRVPVVDRLIENNIEGPIYAVRVEMPHSARILQVVPENTSRGLEQIDNAFIKLLSQKLQGTPLENIFKKLEVLQSKTLRTFIRDKNDSPTYLSDDSTTEKTWDNIHKFGVEVDLYKYFETWVSFEELMMRWAIPTNPDATTFILAFDNSSNVFKTSIDSGVDITHIAGFDIQLENDELVLIDKEKGTSFRNLLLEKDCGIIIIDWIDDSSNPFYANYDVLSADVIEFNRLDSLCLRLKSIGNQLVGLDGKPNRDFNFKYHSKYFGLELSNFDEYIAEVDKLIIEITEKNSEALNRRAAVLKRIRAFVVSDGQEF